MGQGDNSILKENSTEKPITVNKYFFGLLIIFASSYSQYLVDIGPVLGIFIIYVIPVLAANFLWGPAIIRRAFVNKQAALKFGLAWFGAFTFLGILVASAIFFVTSMLDPTAVNLLNRPNPVLNIPPEFAWVMVGVSMLVVGPVEEYLFRGFIYGGLLSLFKGRHWFSLAFVSSLLFAAAHLYYAIVYGITSLIPFTDLVTFGIAMAATFYLSGGNLLIPAIIHGAYDATGFIGVATSLEVGTFLREAMILIGIVVAIALFAQGRQKQKPTPSVGVLTSN